MAAKRESRRYWILTFIWSVAVVIVSALFASYVVELNETTSRISALEDRLNERDRMLEKKLANLDCVLQQSLSIADDQKKHAEILSKLGTLTADKMRVIAEGRPWDISAYEFQLLIYELQEAQASMNEKFNELSLTCASR